MLGQAMNSGWPHCKRLPRRTSIRSETSQQVIGYLEAFNREGKTIVMVTRDPRAAERATRTLRLTEGKIVAEEQSGGCLHVA